MIIRILRLQSVSSMILSGRCYQDNLPRLLMLFKFAIGLCCVVSMFNFFLASSAAVPTSFRVRSSLSNGYNKQDITTTTQQPLFSLSILSTETPKNPHQFHYVLNEEDVCRKRRADVFLLTFIHSAPGNYRQRMLIRDTWGSSQHYPMVKNVVLFAVGQSLNNSTNTAIRLESERFHDIIQEDFVDSYKNLTYKAILWLKWTSLYCPNALYVVKLDDDMVVNIFNLAKHLLHLYTRQMAAKRSILCLLWNGMPVMRDRDNKWFVAKEDYPNDQFSTYCSGSAYIISSDLIYPMYEASLRTKFFWIDDFYITGLLPKQLNVTYHNLNSLYVLKATETTNKLVDSYSLFGHMPGSLSSRYALWKEVLKMRGINQP